MIKKNFDQFSLMNTLIIRFDKYYELFSEKTYSNPPIKTAFLTMKGDAVKSDNVYLSHPLEQISSGDIGWGHTK